MEEMDPMPGLYTPSRPRSFTLSYLRPIRPRPAQYPHLKLTRQTRIYRARPWHVDGDTLAALLGQGTYLIETLDMFPNLSAWSLEAFRRVEYVISDHVTSLVAFRLPHSQTVHLRPYAEYFGNDLIRTHHGIRVNDPEFPISLDTLYRRRAEMEREGIYTRIIPETPRQTRITLD